MALGNNLKRVKKDSLIPDKKKETAAKTKKVATKSTPSPKKEEVNKPSSKAKKSTVAATPKVKKNQTTSTTKTQKSASTTAAKTKVTASKNQKSTASAAPKTAKLTLKPNLEEKILLGGDENSAITVKLIPSRRKSVRKTKLLFEGSLSLLEAEAIKDCLLTTFNEYDLIDIQLSNITQLDLIPIQLIKVFSSHYPDKKVKVDSDLPFDIKIIVERAGFGSLMFKEEVA